MIIDKRGLTENSYIISRVKDGVPIDDLAVPLKQIKKGFTLVNKVPAGSYIGYLISNGSEVEVLFSDKTKAMRDYRSSKKNFKELSVIEVYMNKHGDVIDDMVIA